jgi:uncharacterized protein
MIIKLYDIEQNISVKGRLDGSRYQRPEDIAISFSAPIEYELTVTKSGDNLWVHGPVRARVSTTCDRCLEDFTFSIESELDIELTPKEKAPAAPELELKSEEMDVYYFEGEEVDLDPYVFEEVMLNIPIKALCSESCMGLCPTCGKNLNLGECRCEKAGSRVLADKLEPFLKE